MARRAQHALQFLQSAHEMYGTIGQRERKDCALMAELGHPELKAYRVLRTFFDSLRYAANHGCRHFSFVHEHEKSSYHAPQLELSWTPQGKLATFGRVFPADSRWEDYIREAARLHWQGCGPRLDPGRWSVQTTSSELVSQLRALEQLHVSSYSGETGISITVTCNTLQAHRELIKLLRKHHLNFILPKRSVQDDNRDDTPRALAQRPFLLGNVPALTVTDHYVLAPLLPAGAEGRTKALEVVQDLEALFAQGYPFQAASAWLSRVLDKASFRRMESRHAQV